MIGCGLMGTEHTDGYVLNPRIELVAAADPNPDNLSRFGERFGIPPESRYADYRDLLARERIEIAGIVTPVKVTHDAVLAATAAGVKAVFAEKPIAASLAEADEMVEVCRRSGTAFACGAIARNHPNLQTAKRLLHEESVLGKLLTADMLHGSDEISGGGCHVLNVVRLLVDSEVDWVVGWMKENALSDDDQGAGGILHFASGVECFVHRTVGAKTGVEVLCERGSLFWDWHRIRILADKAGSVSKDRALGELEFPYPPIDHPAIYPPITYGLRSLIECIEKGGDPMTSGEDMRRVLEIGIAMRESERHGHIPVHLPLADRSLTMRPRDRRWLGVKPIETE